MYIIYWSESLQVYLLLLWAGRMLEHDCFVLDRSSRGRAESPIEFHVHLFGLSAYISNYTPLCLQMYVISSHRIFPDRDDVTTVRHSIGGDVPHLYKYYRYRAG